MQEHITAGVCKFRRYYLWEYFGVNNKMANGQSRGKSTSNICKIK